MSDGNATSNATNIIFHNETVVSTAAEDEIANMYMTDDWPAYLMWIQKFFATLSIICSYVVCREIISDLMKRPTRKASGSSRSSNNGNVPLQRSIGRILLNVSISDIVFSFAVFLGEWPAPKDTWYIHHAAGNQQLCTFQGWLRALGYMASPMFSVALNVFYLLLIRYRWSGSDLSSLEKKVTIGIWAYALVLSIIPIPLEAYNSDWDVCWIVPSPLDCVGDECTRGQIATKLEIFYSFIHIWTCMFVSVILMIMLFRTVKNLEDKSRNHVARGTTQAVVRSTENFCDESTRKVCDNSARYGCDTSGRPPLEQSEESMRPTDIEQPRDKMASSVRSCPGEHARSKRSRVSSLLKRISWHRLSSRFELQKNTYSKSRAVAYQGILFTLAFLSTHLFDMISSILWRTRKMWNFYFDLVAYMIMQPALGILNFLIFSRNRKKMATPEGRVIRKIAFSCACICGLCTRNPNNRNNEEPKSNKSSSSNNDRSFNNSNQSNNRPSHTSSSSGEGGNGKWKSMTMAGEIASDDSVQS